MGVFKCAKYILPSLFFTTFDKQQKCIVSSLVKNASSGQDSARDCTKWASAVRGWRTRSLSEGCKSGPTWQGGAAEPLRAPTAHSSRTKTSGETGTFQPNKTPLRDGSTPATATESRSSCVSRSWKVRGRPRLPRRERRNERNQARAAPGFPTLTLSSWKSRTNSGLGRAANHRE